MENSGGLTGLRLAALAYENPHQDAHNDSPIPRLVPAPKAGGQIEPITGCLAPIGLSLRWDDEQKMSLRGIRRWNPKRHAPEAAHLFEVDDAHIRTNASARR